MPEHIEAGPPAVGVTPLCPGGRCPESVGYEHRAALPDGPTPVTWPCIAQSLVEEHGGTVQRRTVTVDPTQTALTGPDGMPVYGPWEDAPDGH